VFCVALLAVWLPAGGQAQVNSGSDGSDGPFNPTTNTVINMADHPTGIYQYTSVNISSGVTVSFIPNANNTPIVWLVQSNCVIAGTVTVPGGCPFWINNYAIGGTGGPGGWGGGSGGAYPSPGQGPGGSMACSTNLPSGGSFGSQGQSPGPWAAAGAVYGNSFLVPILGGSGGGGYNNGSTHGGGGGGGGGGGAILIAASSSIQLNGSIYATGGCGVNGGGGGSGGGVRVVATSFTGSGLINANGGDGGGGGSNSGGQGRIRIDAYQSTFGGTFQGVVSQGFQPIILPTTGVGAQLTISSIGGVAVSPSPSGILTVPDAVISAQQANPIPVVVNCANIPLNTAITISVRPASGASVTAVGHNTTGTQASSTATVLINIPRGGGIIWATAATGS